MRQSARDQPKPGPPRSTLLPPEPHGSSCSPVLLLVVVLTVKLRLVPMVKLELAPTPLRAQRAESVVVVADS